MASDVFVSHSIKDKAVAEAIVARLEADSLTCWIAPRDVVPGADWGESIIDAIESSRIMILIFSRNADASPQIKREVERAVNKGVYIIPFRLADIPPTRALEYFISTSQWMDAFSPPLERHLDNLAKTVRTVLKSPPLPSANVPAQSESESLMASQISHAPVSGVVASPHGILWVTKERCRLRTRAHPPRLRRRPQLPNRRNMKSGTTTRPMCLLLHHRTAVPALIKSLRQGRFL